VNAVHCKCRYKNIDQIKSVREEACQPKWQSCEKTQFKDEEPGGGGSY
jgi:hypothetical protein